jgi:hypothetical protein
MDILGHIISHWSPVSKYSDAEANNLTEKIDVNDFRLPLNIFKNP